MQPSIHINDHIMTANNSVRCFAALARHAPPGAGARRLDGAVLLARHDGLGAALEQVVMQPYPASR